MKLHGQVVLVVIDVQKGEALAEDAGIPHMSGGGARHARIVELVESARAAAVPVVFVQEVHKRTLLDFGRELDGAEGVHCLEGDAATELADGLDPRPDEYLIRKRRYSAFFGTELEIVLKSYGARTLVLVGALTDVCVHLTFADAHQHDYHVRVATDAVGGSSQEAHDASLRAMEYLQTGALTDSETITEAFRAWSGPPRPPARSASPTQAAA